MQIICASRNAFHLPLCRRTNDHLRSTTHRVFKKLGRERYSIPFFVAPDFDTEVWFHLNNAQSGEQRVTPPTHLAILDNALLGRQMLVKYLRRLIFTIKGKACLYDSLVTSLFTLHGLSLRIHRFTFSFRIFQVACLPQFCSEDNPAKYAPTTSGAYLLQKILELYPKEDRKN